MLTLVLTVDITMNKYFFIIFAMAIIGMIGALYGSHQMKNLKYARDAKSIHKRSTFPQNPEHNATFPCTSHDQCGEGKCVRDTFNYSITYCECNERWTTVFDLKGYNNTVCNYKRINSVMPLLLSLFLGYFGVDWFVLGFDALGKETLTHGLHSGVGFVKLITLGGVGIWWIIDICLIGVGFYPDGNGVPMTGF